MNPFKNLKLAQKDESIETNQAQDAGFHSFPEISKKKFSFPKFGGKKLGTVGIGIVAVAVLLGVLIGIPAIAVFNSVQKLQTSSEELKNAIDAQDLDKTRSSLAKVRQDLKGLDNSLGILTWMSPIPFVGGYVQDAKHASKGGLAGIEAGEIVLKVIEPYSDILGFSGGQQAQDGQETAEDRINFIVETIEQVIPHLDEISSKTLVMNEEFSKINPNRYPEEFRGKKVRSRIHEAIAAVNSMHQLVTGGKPILEKAPYLLGIDGERTYLMLFQNDKELRPTGGFLTAYSIIKVKNGKFEPVTSNDIYNLDNKLKSKIPAPDPIKKYLPLVPYWNMRDMNLSPDFKSSMDTFTQYYKETKSPEFDGIIAVDTKLAVDLLEVIGPIGVPGFGNFSAENDSRCNCPVVIYELESYADVAGPIIWADDLGGKIILKPANSDNRKAILGPLMNSLLSNAMGQPKEKIPALFEAGFSALMEKHVLFYFDEGEAQSAMEAFNLAGRVKEFEGDYLHINDTNFAGAKSNLYIEEEVNLKVEPQKDGTLNTLTIKYKNPQKHDGWLNGPYRDFLRVYVPKGSTLVDSSGSEVDVTTYEDLGKTVFEGFFMLRPLGVVELKFQYKTPVKQNGQYKILIQKQPGTDGHLYNVNVKGQKEEFLLKTDKELRF